jgi:hypothetical protein
MLAVFFRAEPFRDPAGVERENALRGELAEQSKSYGSCSGSAL